MQTTEQTATPQKKPWLLRVGYPLALAATVFSTVFVAGGSLPVILTVAAGGFAVSMAALFGGIALHEKRLAASSAPIAADPASAQNKNDQPSPKKEKKMTVETSPAPASTLTDAAKGLVVAVGTVLLSLFALPSDAPKAQDKPGKDEPQKTYVISPAILNNENERRRPSNPKKPGQKKALRALFNIVVPRVIGKVVNKPQGRPYPQTHIKRGACNNLRMA